MWIKYLLALSGALILAFFGYLRFSAEGAQLPDDIASGNGRIEAVQIDISTRIAGRVQDVVVKEGDLVNGGQIVAKIDAAQLRARHLRGQAEIASAESQVAAAEASIAQANAQLTFARQELNRAARLVEQAYTSRETYDTRVSEHNVAKAGLAAAEATLVSRQRGVDAARASVQEIETQIDDCVLTAPTIGRVLYRLTEPGEVLGSGGKVMTLVNLSDIYMELFLPATHAHRISIGAEARIKLDILDVAIPAVVSFVSPASQFTPKQVETMSERDKLMFRVKVRISQDLVMKYIDRAKIGVRGVAYVRLSRPLGEEPSPWPEFLQKFPPGVSATARSKLAPKTDLI